VRKILLLLAAASGMLAPAAQSRENDARPFVPVFTKNFPDPFILPHGGGFLAYATNADGGRANVQMARSTNLVDWALIEDGGKLHDAMPVLPTWARGGFTWAPEVMQVGGRWLLYFSARERKSDLQCVGVAVASSPMGPFASTAPEPLVCQRAEGGTIDASPFRDTDGKLHLVHKSDGNNPRVLKPSRILVQSLAPDGLSVTSGPIALIQNSEHWEWRVVESPTIVPTPGGGYTLFFSANHFGWEADQRLSNYAVGYAQCASLAGPCVKARENPILHSYNTRTEGCLSGPGHQTVFTVGKRQLVAFHAWAATPGCTRRKYAREMYVAPLLWEGKTPKIGVSMRAAQRPPDLPAR